MTRCVAGLLLAAAASAQQAAVTEPLLTVDMLVNLDGSYRDGAWVPVDVIVRNEDRDIAGWVEIRTYVNNELQSPIYRVRADSPRGSYKRFRLYCKLESSNRIEAMIYHGERRMLDVPVYQMIRPAAPHDVFGMLLAEDPADFAFVLPVVQAHDPARSFFRKRLDDSSLELFPEHPACLESYDFIAIGDIDTGRLTERHRQALETYVRNGGVVVILTGANTRKVRDSWLEALAGVTIGAPGVVNEEDLATRVFGTPGPARGGQVRQCMVAPLTAVSEDARVFGDPPLGILRPLNQGYVVTFAVDATTRALQDHPGYRALWRDILLHPRAHSDLNFGQAESYLLNALPEMAGIQLFSKESVMVYLALYFLIAIVLNWLVCNRLGRREMAWVVLVVCSAGFTLYAVVFGSAGRATANELEQIDIIELAAGRDLARVQRYFGLLTARSTRYNVDAPGPDALFDDIRTVSSQHMGMGYRRVSRPFIYVQGALGQVQNLAIGASELRMLAVRDSVTMAGGFEGAAILDPEGVSGEWVNTTGIPIDRAWLVLDGDIHPCQIDGTRISVMRDPAARQAFGPFAEYAQLSASPRYALNTFNNRAYLPEGLLWSMIMAKGGGGLSRNIGPYLIATTSAPILPPITADVELDANIRKTLLVGATRIEASHGAHERAVSLAVSHGVHRGRIQEFVPTSPYTEINAPQGPIVFTMSMAETELAVDAGPLVTSRDMRPLYIDFHMQGTDQPVLKVRASLDNSSARRAIPYEVSVVREGDASGTIYRVRLTITDWQDFMMHSGPAWDAAQNFSGRPGGGTSAQEVKAVHFFIAQEPGQSSSALRVLHLHAWTWKAILDATQEHWPAWQ